MNARSGTVVPTIDVEAAREHIARAALADCDHSRVGLELEFHVVDLARPGRRPTWIELTDLLTTAGRLPGRSAVTLEPGGQVELSGLPMADVSSAIRILRTDAQALRRAAAEHGLGLAPLGADPARPPMRVATGSRYAAMESHFDAMGCGDAGRRMMASTAALQVNLDAGRADRWAERVDHVHAIGPVLCAIAACSPMLGGRSSGWAGMREQAWQGIDRRRTGPVTQSADPASAWADYALTAPVMLIRDGERAAPVNTRISLEQWIRSPGAVGRPATIADIDYHLTTLFPPVRLRGYLELRFLDAVPDRWWPALAAIAVTLIDDPVGADHAAEACAPVAGAWTRAARDGLRDAQISAAARRCMAIAASRCPVDLREQVDQYAALIERARTPGDELLSRIRAVGPGDALAEPTALAEHTTGDRNA